MGWKTNYFPFKGTFSVGYVTLPGVYCISKNPLRCCQSRWLATSKRWLSRWYTRIVSFRGIGGSRVYQENVVYHIKTRWWFQIFFYFHPYLGKIPILTSIFFRWVETMSMWCDEATGSKAPRYEKALGRVRRLR